MRAGFLLEAKPYFFSSGLDSLGEEGIGVVDDDELAAPPAELDAPVPPGVASGFDASPGAGEGVGVGAGEAVGALGAGGVVVVFCSSFLQAVRLTATRAAIRSERVIIVFL